jgi:Ca-activated chloride channel family protein
MNKSIFWLMLATLCVLTACGIGAANSPTAAPSAQLPGYMNQSNETYGETGSVPRPDNAIDIYIVYSPESQQYLPRIIEAFNRASGEGRNPVTGQNYGSGERPIYVRGQQPTTGSSGSVAQGIVNAIIAPNNANVYHPTIFQPSVSHWLALINYQTGRTIFDLSAAQPTALTPVVIGMWESRVRAIQQTIGAEEIGWDDLLGVLNSANGWEDYGIPNGRRAVYYGHTDPSVSSTGLSTTIMEYYACARKNSFADRLSLQAVGDASVQDCVRSIENLVRHYSSRTEDFLEYVSRGPEYLDFLALEETDLICLNRGAQQGDEVCNRPSERLVAIYPKEGTFWHEHPFATLNADWVTEEQRQAASVFTDFVLTPDMQRLIMAEGFRPANPDVPLEFPFVEENGVDPAQPSAVLDVPAPEVITAIQQNWTLVKKPADIMLLIDVSGSMSTEGKIDQAIQAAQAFLDGMESTNRVGLTVFSDNVQERIPLGNFESVEETLRSNINALRAEGGTELFAAVRDVVTTMNDTAESDRIRAVVLLSDGADTGDQGITITDALNAISASRSTRNPVILVPVAYGSDADVNALNTFARASATSVQSGDPQNILRVLQIISSYF